MRGFAPTIHCPRCHEPAATGAGTSRLVTCSKCTLVFDVDTGMRTAPIDDARASKAAEPSSALAPVRSQQELARRVAEWGIPVPHKLRDETLSLWITQRPTARRFAIGAGIAGAFIGALGFMTGGIPVSALVVGAALVVMYGTRHTELVRVDRELVRGRQQIRGAIAQVKIREDGDRFFVDAVEAGATADTVDQATVTICEAPSLLHAQAVSITIMQHRAAVGAPVGQDQRGDRSDGER